MGWVMVVKWSGWSSGQGGQVGGEGGQVVRVVTYMGCLVPLGVVKDEEWNPEPLNILESERILRAA